MRIFNKYKVKNSKDRNYIYFGFHLDKDMDRCLLLESILMETSKGHVLRMIVDNRYKKDLEATNKKLTDQLITEVIRKWNFIKLDKNIDGLSQEEQNKIYVQFFSDLEKDFKELGFDEVAIKGILLKVRDCIK